MQFAGYIRDLTGNYKWSIFTIGILPILDLLLWFFMPLAIKFDKKKDAARITQP